MRPPTDLERFANSSANRRRETEALLVQEVRSAIWQRANRHGYTQAELYERLRQHGLNPLGFFSRPPTLRALVVAAEAVGCRPSFRLLTRAKT